MSAGKLQQLSPTVIVWNNLIKVVGNLIFVFLCFYHRITNVIKERSYDVSFYNHDITCESNEHFLDDCPKRYVKSRNIARYCNSNSYVYLTCDEIKEKDVLKVPNKIKVSENIRNIQ